MSIWTRWLNSLKAAPKKTRRLAGKTDAKQRKNLNLRVAHLEDRVVPAATILTDKLDYSPGQTALITGSGFQANETVDLQVLNLTAGGTLGGNPGSWTVQTDAQGNLGTTWTCTTDLLNTNLELDAKG